MRKYFLSLYYLSVIAGNFCAYKYIALGWNYPDDGVVFFSTGLAVFLVVTDIAIVRRIYKNRGGF